MDCNVFDILMDYDWFEKSLDCNHVLHKTVQANGHA